MTTSRAIFALLGISFSSGKQCLVVAIFMIGVIYFWGCVSRLLLSSFKVIVGDYVSRKTA